jgi:hypothetical protein
MIKLSLFDFMVSGSLAGVQNGASGETVLRLIGPAEESSQFGESPLDSYGCIHIQYTPSGFVEGISIKCDDEWFPGAGVNLELDPEGVYVNMTSRAFLDLLASRLIVPRKSSNAEGCDIYLVNGKTRALCERSPEGNGRLILISTYGCN